MPTGTMKQKQRQFGTTMAVRIFLQESVWQKLALFFQREQVFDYTLIAPAFILLGVLVAWPFFMALYLCVTDSWVSPTGSFIGLRNYWHVLPEGIFIETLQNSLVLTFSAVFLKTVRGMALVRLLFRTARFNLKWVITSLASPRERSSEGSIKPVVAQVSV
jgi:ABC-type sugar transport system permease subunit